MRFGSRARYVPTKFNAVVSIIVAVGMAAVAASAGILKLAGPGLLFAILWFGILALVVGANVYFLATGRWIMGPEVQTSDSGIPVQVVGQGTIEERLGELDRLHASGRVTRTEYDEQRRRILKEI